MKPELMTATTSSCSESKPLRLLLRKSRSGTAAGSWRATGLQDKTETITLVPTGEVAEEAEVATTSESVRSTAGRTETVKEAALLEAEATVIAFLAPSTETTKTRVLSQSHLLAAVVAGVAATTTRMMARAGELLNPVVQKLLL